MPAVRGDLIRHLRQQKGEKAGEFAAAIRISPKHLVNVEGSGAPCAIEVVHRIAQRLGVPAEELLADPREPRAGA